MVDGYRSDSRKKRSTMREKQQLDMLHGTIWDKIPRFALPVAATAILEQLFNASDIAVVVYRPSRRFAAVERGEGDGEIL